MVVPRSKKGTTIEQRFMKFVSKSDNGCWLWIGAFEKNPRCLPYGWFYWVGRGKLRAHRVSYELFVGELGKSQCVLHKCDNPKCVNPDHLSTGTQADNIRDMIAKGRDNSWGNKRWSS